MDCSLLPFLMRSSPWESSVTSGACSGRMPSWPITPKKITMGSRVGRIARNPIRTDRNITDITTKMTPSAIVRLSICPVTMPDREPPSSTSVPVRRTGRSFGKCSAT